MTMAPKTRQRSQTSSQEAGKVDVDVSGKRRRSQRKWRTSSAALAAAASPAQTPAPKRSKKPIKSIEKQSSKASDFAVASPSFAERFIGSAGGPPKPIDPHSNAIDHLKLFPKIVCDHQSCRHSLVYDDEIAMETLSHHDNWWPCGFVGAFASLIAHVSGHEDSTVVIHWYSNAESWYGVDDINRNTKKVIVLELQKEHYTMTIIYISLRMTFRLNGYVKRPSRVRRSNKNLDQLVRLSPEYLGSASQYKAIEQPYLVQHDSSSCGPIIVLAFYKEYTGTDLFEAVAGSDFDPLLRKALVDYYVHQYRNLLESGSLVHGTGRKSGKPWSPPPKRLLSFSGIAKALTRKGTSRSAGTHLSKGDTGPTPQSKTETPSTPFTPTVPQSPASTSSSELKAKQFGRILSYREESQASVSEESSEQSIGVSSKKDNDSSIDAEDSIEVEQITELISKVTFASDSMNESVYFNIHSPSENLLANEGKGPKEKGNESTEKPTEETTDEPTEETTEEPLDTVEQKIGGIPYEGVLSKKGAKTEKLNSKVKKNVDKPRRRQLRVGKPAKRFSDLEGKTSQRLLMQAWEYLNKYMTATSPSQEKDEDPESGKWPLIHSMAVLLNPYPPIKKGKRTFESTMENLPDKQHAIFFYRDEESWEAMLDVFRSVLENDDKYRISKFTDWQSAVNAYRGKTNETAQLVAAPKNMTPDAHARKVVGLASPGSPATPYC